MMNSEVVHGPKQFPEVKKTSFEYNNCPLIFFNILKILYETGLHFENPMINFGFPKHYWLNFREKSGRISITQ